MISNIHLAHLRNNEFVRFHHDVVTILERSNPVDLGIEDACNELHTSAVALDTSFKTERGSALTEDIAEADTRRDRAFNGIMRSADALTNHYKAEISKAAETLVTRFKQAPGALTRLNYKAQTTETDDLINDLLSEGSLLSALEVLGHINWVKEAKAANNEFKKLYHQRVSENTADVLVPFAQVRIAALENYRKVVDLIEALIIIKGAEKYSTLVNELNTLIDDYNQVIKRRSQVS